MNVVTLTVGLVLVAIGGALLIAGRRRRLTRIAAGEDPGRGVALGVAAAFLGVGLLAVARSFSG